MTQTDDELYYPTVADLIEIHDDIVSDDSDSTRGVQSRSKVENAVDRMQSGVFGKEPETIHEKAASLLRNIASNHPFVDGNKRTAIAATVSFYFANGYELDYGEDLKALVKVLAVRDPLVDKEELPAFLGEKVTSFEIDDLPREQQFALLLGVLSDVFGEYIEEWEGVGSAERLSTNDEYESL